MDKMKYKSDRREKINAFRFPHRKVIALALGMGLFGKAAYIAESLVGYSIQTNDNTRQVGEKLCFHVRSLNQTTQMIFLFRQFYYYFLDV